jgi:hypothetical protein
LNEVDQELNKGINTIVDKVYDDVKNKVGKISTPDEELRDICSETTKTELKTKTKSVFGVTTPQLLIILGATIIILLVFFGFIFVGMLVFKGESVVKTFINTGLVAGAGMMTNMSHSKSGSKLFQNVIPKIQKLLAHTIETGIMGPLSKELSQKVMHKLMDDDDRLKELVLHAGQDDPA